MKNKISSILLLFVLLAALVPSYEINAQGETTTLELQPDGASLKDTLIALHSGSNYGTADTIGVGEGNNGTWTNRSLLEFDFSGLPRDVIVESATLELTVKNDYSSNARTMSVYAINNSWTESSATWTYRSGFNPWQTAGASGANDVLPDAIGTVSIADTLTRGTKVSITFTDMNALAAMFKQNLFGFKLQMDTESNDEYDFYSSDTATATNRPKLTITYTPIEPDLTAGWTCVNVSPYNGCSDAALAAPPITPFNGAGLMTGPWGVMGGTVEHLDVRPQVAAKLNCYPYPRCINDYPIYYRFTYDAAWTAPGGTQAALGMKLETNGNDIWRGVPCGAGLTGRCKGVFEGEIAITDMPENLDAGFTIGLDTGLSFPSSYYPAGAISWTLYLSLVPFDQNCAETWYVTVPDTYVIDPTLEAPLGMAGTPADNQIYPTVIDQVYMVRVENGPWNDGTTDSTAAAVSYDGITWMTWEEFSVDAVCIDISSVDPFNTDYRIIYFTAPTETFYIRVDDTAAAFADNTNSETTPFQYVIGIALELAGPVDCESQFSFDPENDIVGSVSVISTSNDVQANDYIEPLEGGAWYAVRVTSGTWHENSPTTERKDMEFAFSGTIGSSLNWADLADGSALVQCASTDGVTTYIQAPAGTDLALHLHVNDQDTPQNFADNTGTLEVSIYKSTFTRQIDGCELQFDVGTFVSHGEVEANASNGLEFAIVFSTTTSSTDPLPNLGSDVTYSYGLTPGGWYMLETTQGPWWQTFTGGGYESTKHYYDVKLKSIGGEWSTPETWPLAECAVTIDALGHQRIYFQAPDNGTYYIKVGGAGPFGRGSMGWDLYQAMDLGLGETSDCQDYIYDPNVAHGIGTVDSQLSNGAPIVGLATDQFFAVQIESANTASDPPYYENSGWYENEGATEQDDLEFTVDGTNWSDLPNHPAVLCFYYTPESNELVFFFRTLNGQTPKLRANSTTFSNNTGLEYYRVYQATAGDNVDPWTGCSDDYQATVPAINEYESIPPQDEEGIMLMPTLTYVPELDPDGDGIILWGSPGLEAGHFFMVQMVDGPWGDGVHPLQKYNAQLSSDGGATWFSFKDHPDVICSTIDQMKMYEKAIFEVTTGQQWKIRVADTETDVFTDNTGHSAYRLTLVNEFPVDGPGSVATDYDPGAFDVCSQSLVRPQALSLSEIGSIGNYFGDWVQYINRSLLSYFAWCPRHTDMIISAMNALKTREPLATIAELITVQKNVRTEVDSYDWGGGGYQDTSIFGANSSAKVEQIFDHIIPQNGEGVSPWEDGGNLVNFNVGSGLPAYYYTCDSVFADYLPSRLRIGVCFASAYWKETGASFWVQLSLDLSAIGLLFVMTKGALQSLVYMMTGVRPWTKDGASRMIVEVAGGSELIQPVEKWRTRR